MLCEKCKSNQAVYHTVSVINGAKEERHLCAQCAKEYNGFISPFSSLINYGGNINTKSRLSCGVCGLSYDEFLETGMLGCDKCYESFRARLPEVINKVQAGNKKHISAAKPEKVNGNSPSLKEQLKRAIEAEDYEEAARIRDIIRKEEAQNAGE